MVLDADSDPFDRASPGRAFAEALHGFAWMRDLIALGAPGALEALRLTLTWLDQFGQGRGFAWAPHVLERRAFNLACGFTAMLRQADRGEKPELAAMMLRHTRQLLGVRFEPSRTAERTIVTAVAACALADLDENRLLDRILPRVVPALAKIVREDGVHISRSPLAGVELLFDLLSLDEALIRLGQAGYDEIPRSVDRLSAAARFLTLPTGQLASFQGGGGGEIDYIAAAIAHDVDSGRLPDRLGSSGYHRLEGRDLVVLADAGPPARGVFSVTACAQPLAIDVTVGQCPLIVGSCWIAGQHMASHLRLTPAGSTATLAGGSAGEVMTGWRADQFGPRLIRAAREVAARRFANNHATWLEASHDGWLKPHNLIHARRLYLDIVQDELRGEDSFVPPSEEVQRGPRRHIPIDVRFHLHPKVQATLARDRRSVMLRGSPTQVWWLRNDAVEVALEPTTVPENGISRRGEQIVLRGQVRPEVGGRIRWKLTRVES